jgi:nucleoside-diphosphate-sugar epimerase
MTTIFVTGATGALGTATLPRLRDAGHAVRALSRSAANDVAIRALGAEPIRADLFDLASLRTAMAGADAALHLATRIPPFSDLRRRSAWAENDRIRAEGTRNIVDAALATAVRTVVYPSFDLIYGDHGDAWIDAASTQAEPAAVVVSTIAAEREVARFAAADNGRRGVSLRFGGLYGPGLPSTEQQFAMARRGIAPLFGPASAYTPTLWIDDAATALIAALDRAPSGVYDVVDDEPLPRGDMVRALAAAVGRKRLVLPPRWLAGPMIGPAGDAFARSMRVSNQRFEKATGWRPMMRNAREGFATLAAGAAELQPAA